MKNQQKGTPMTTQRMLSLLRKCVEKYELIKDGDKIAVGLSGGKDSLTLLKLLAEYRRFSPQKFDLVATTIDLAFNDKETDLTPLKDFCENLGVEYYIEKTEIGKVIFDVRKETNPCSLCAKMRRGALNSLAKQKNCNKVALGHHKDDLIQTFFLSLLYEGRLSSFAPKSYLDKTELTVIRPMLYIEECDVISYSKDLPVMFNCCPANKKTKREYAKDVISGIAKDVPNVRDMIFTALVHPERYNLFDKFESDAEKF